MRTVIITIFILFQAAFLFGQDGSNMNYVKPAELNETYIGRRLHLDFGQRSFAIFDDKRSLDTIIIDINGKKVKFIEHRVDDGFNNWFKDQYLEAVESVDGLKLRVKEFEILKINEKDILVKGSFVFIDKNEQVLPERSFIKDLTFEKTEIVEYLFKAKE